MADKRKTWHGEPHMPYFQIPDFPVRLHGVIGSLAALKHCKIGEIAARCIQAGLPTVQQWVEEELAKEKREWNPNGE